MARRYNRKTEKSQLRTLNSIAEGNGSYDRAYKFPTVSASNYNDLQRTAEYARSQGLGREPARTRMGVGQYHSKAGKVNSGPTKRKGTR